MNIRKEYDKRFKNSQFIKHAEIKTFIESVILDDEEVDFILQYLDVIVEHLKKKRPENVDRIDRVAMRLKEKLNLYRS